MKAKVLKAFIDKHTGEYHNVGTFVDVTEKRAKEILSSGAYIEVVKEEKPVFDEMSLKMLRTYAEEHGIDISSGKNKAEILDIIKNQQ